MVRFEWKYTDKDQWPPEPEQTKNGWKLIDPGMNNYEIRTWWDDNFEIYACKLFGLNTPVPSQLYYIGDNRFMADDGHVFEEGMVLAWDSYTEDT